MTNAIFPAIAPPLRYDSSMEVLEQDEGQTAAALVESLLSISRKTFEDSGHARRSVHAKSHGLIQGELRVLDGLPDILAQGLFSQPRSYPTIMRFSATPGDLLDDKVSTPRGLSIKIMGVEGERLPETEADATQDFVLINGPAFNAPNAKKFLSSLQLLAATTDKAEGLKKIFSAAARGAEAVVETFGGKSSLLTGMGGHPTTHVLGETYYSQVPMLYGPFIAKVSVAPVSPEMMYLKDVPVDLDDKPNGLRDAVVDFFRKNRGEWEIRVQLCTDLKAMPVEDASVVWPEDQSPYVAVARLSAPLQDAWNDIKTVAIEDGLSFSPWHGLTAHRPLGSIMRVRKMAYEMSARFRSHSNNLAIVEPRCLEDLNK